LTYEHPGPALGYCRLASFPRFLRGAQRIRMQVKGNHLPAHYMQSIEVIW